MQDALVFGFHDQALRLPPDGLAAAEIAFLTALSAFIAPLLVGSMRHRPLTFWADLARLSGRQIMHASHLALHRCPEHEHADLVGGVRGHIGLVQLAIALAMLAATYAVQVPVDHQEQLLRLPGYLDAGLG